MIRLRESTKDGTPCAMKVACTVWSGGKFSDNLKELPITIKLQFIARTIIAGLLAQNADYHQPYRDCKSAFESYGRMSYINQRLLQEANR